MKFYLKVTACREPEVKLGLRLCLIFPKLIFIWLSFGRSICLANKFEIVSGEGGFVNTNNLVKLLVLKSEISITRRSKASHEYTRT